MTVWTTHRVVGRLAVWVVLALGMGSLLGCSSAGTSQLGEVSWDSASAHAGENTTVGGPVINTHYAADSKGSPTFINIGRDYPDAGRFQVIVFGDSRGAFQIPPEDMYRGKDVVVSGTIEMYEGIPEIIVDSPDDITIVN